MALSFAVMFAFVGFALWLHQRKATRLPAPRSKRQVTAPAAAVETAPMPAATPAPAAAPAHIAATSHIAALPIDEPTEFVALPHLREPDSPGPEPRTEIVAVFEGTALPAEPTLVVSSPAERTWVVSSLAEPPPFVPEKTEFIPAPLGRLSSNVDLPEHLQRLHSWDDPRAEPLAAASLARAQDPDTRALWLDCFAERGWDPGVTAIEAALTDADPHLVTLGLRLLPRCAAAPRLQTKLAGLLFAHEAAVRMQALETALAFGNESAWLVCRQLARNPSFPAAAQLVGLLGTEAEVTEQCRALEFAPTAELLGGLGLSGRPVVLRACVARFEDPDPKLREAAHAMLTLAAGSAFESITNAQTWLASQQHPRMLGGKRRWAAQVTAVLGTADDPLRRLLTRELRIRSQTKLHVDASLAPDAFARQLAQVKECVAEIDFDRGFPWSLDANK